MRLKGNVAIITGAGRGIGRETALLFAREGARVVIADFDEKFGQETMEKINRDGGEAVYVPVDVADSNSVRNMVQQVLDKFGTVDILINNAGITRDGFLVKMTEENFDQVIGVNLKGVFNCTKAVAPVMIAKGRGKVINTSSVVGIYGNMGQTNYAATKAGVIGMTKTWSRELGAGGINVNAVAPGFIETDMTSTVPEKVLQAVRQKTPLGRLGQARDIANAYLFLASADADFINGVVLSVDGGMVL
ncbi:MAG: 3-oxoacyl-ACP reductase FabG [Bacillota bacterium]